MNCFVSYQPFGQSRKVQPSYHSLWEFNIKRNTCWVWQKLVIEHYKCSRLPNSHHPIISSAVWHEGVLKSRLFTSSPQSPALPGINSIWTTGTLRHNSVEQRPRSPPFQTHIPFWLCAKQPEKTSLSLCFNFCLVFMVWHGDCSGNSKEKKNSRRRGEICFTSVLFRENQSRSRQRIHKTVKASVKRAHTQTRRGVCTSSGILYTSWLTEIDKGTNKQGILRH